LPWAAALLQKKKDLRKRKYKGITDKKQFGNVMTQNSQSINWKE
jgi:hypothetical protein